MSKQDVIRFIGSLFLAGLFLNVSLMILSISWGTIFISNVALVILSRYLWAVKLPPQKSAITRKLGGRSTARKRPIGVG
ncbi:hypothetical protein COD67_07465 [Bacillus cereus]|nr:hypothetical protein COI89_04385 [Bacillus cereus]PGU68155.1 hypothetical protein COD67_07465 [Bacillus cereus]